MKSIVQFYLTMPFVPEYPAPFSMNSFNKNSGDYYSQRSGNWRYWKCLYCHKKRYIVGISADLNAFPRTRRIKRASWRNAELKVVVDISLPGIETRRASRRGGLTYTGYNIRLHRTDCRRWQSHKISTHPRRENPDTIEQWPTVCLPFKT